MSSWDHKKSHSLSGGAEGLVGRPLDVHSAVVKHGAETSGASNLLFQKVLMSQKLME